MKDYHEGPCAVQSLGCRVDYLTIAFAVELRGDALQLLRDTGDRARELGGGSAELLLGQLVAHVRPSRDRGVDRWTITTLDLRGQVHTQATGGWTIELTARATYLAQHSVDDAVQLLTDAAAAFGKVRDRRVRRVDLAADFAGFPLDPSIANRWLIPRRGKIGDYRPRVDHSDEDETPARRMYLDAVGRVTGFTICAGGTTSARVYDKTAELLIRPAEKAAIEVGRWANHGWLIMGAPSVTRVEFQLRGEALDELDLRSPSAVCGCGRRTSAIRVESQRCPGGGRCHTPIERPLSGRVDELWQYLTGGWLRLLSRERDPEERADRVGDDPVWQAVREVVFTHEHAPPAGRVRRRGGATYEQALGALLSSLAGTRQLARLFVPPVPRRTCDASNPPVCGSNPPVCGSNPPVCGSNPPVCEPPPPPAPGPRVQLDLDGREVDPPPQPIARCAASSSTRCGVPPWICVVPLDDPDRDLTVTDPITTAALVEVHVQAAMAQAQHFLTKYGDLAREAVATRWNATVARFASVRDAGEAMPPRWTIRGDVTSDSWIVERVSSLSSLVPYDDPDERAAIMAAAEE